MRREKREKLCNQQRNERQWDGKRWASCAMGTGIITTVSSVLFGDQPAISITASVIGHTDFWVTELKKKYSNRLTVMTQIFETAEDIYHGVYDTRQKIEGPNFKPFG